MEHAQNLSPRPKRRGLAASVSCIRFAGPLDVARGDGPHGAFLLPFCLETRKNILKIAKKFLKNVDLE